MSLIACTINISIPIVIGDLLISSDDVSEKPYILPTAGIDISHFLPYNDGLVPFGINQKVYIINKDLCIALAGWVYYMAEFLKDLKYLNRVNDNELTRKQLLEFLENYDSLTISKITVFILLMEHLEDGQVNVFQVAKGYWGTVNTDTYGKVWAAASGSQDFLHYAKQKLEFTTPFPEETIERALTSNVCLIAGLLGLERITLYTAKKLWGAGFETIYYDGNSFKKIDDITYIIWDARFDDNGNINPMPSLILKYKYYGDILGITTIERISKSYGHNFYTALPIDYDKIYTSTNIPEDKSFVSNKIANAFVVQTKDNGVVPITFYTESLDFKVTFLYDKPEIFVHPEILELIKQKAKELFPKL